MISPIQGFQFKNWGENLQFQPKYYYKPSTEEQIVDIIKYAKAQGLKVRVYGSGHSWTHLAEAQGQILINLDNCQGVVQVDKNTKQVTVKAGSKLYALSGWLEKEGLAMQNMGDINKQAFAGALSTGTHGTGISFGIIPTQVVKLIFINGKGEKITCSNEENSEIFKAAQVSLGALGVITEVTIQAVDLYNLHIQKKKEKLSQIIPQLPQIVANNRHFEFYWFPYTDTIQSKYLNITSEKPNVSSFKKWFNDIFLENNAFKLLSEVSRIIPGSGSSKTVSQISGLAISNSSEINVSHKVFSTERLVKFVEMEYGVPAEKGPECLLAIKEFIEKNKIKVHFPIEFRYVKGDDIYISPAYGRDTVFISCHMYLGMPYEAYFRGVEEIFLRFEGRPHWGKMHYQTAAYFEKIYPKWHEFLAIRKQMDPDGLFLNEHLRAIFNTEQNKTL